MTKRKLKSLIAFIAVAFVLLSAGVIMRNFLLGQVKKRIESVFHYSKLHLTLLPPGIVFEDVRTVTLSPFFSAAKVSVRISYLSLFSSEKPLTVFIDRPVLQISDTASREKKDKPSSLFPFPFAIDTGLIRDGQIYYFGKDGTYTAKGVKAFLRIKGDAFVMQAESADNTITMRTLGVPLQGKVRLVAQGKGNKIQITRASLESENLFFKAAGSVTDVNHPTADLKFSYRVQIPMVMNYFSLPFEWRGEAQGDGTIRQSSGKLEIQTSVSSRDLVLNKMPLHNADGRVFFRSGEGGRVEIDVRKPGYLPETMKIGFNKDGVTGTAENVHLDPIMTHIPLPWPVKSPAWGTFTLNQGRLHAEGEFKEEVFDPDSDRYAVRGPVIVDWDGRNKVVFTSENVETVFAKLKVRGDVNTKQSVDVFLQGDVKDVKLAREFTSRILGIRFSFPEIRGQGSASVTISGDYRAPRVKGEFSCAPGGFDVFNARSVSGTAEISKGIFSGDFKVDDPDMKGDVSILAGPDGVETKIRADDAAAQKILPKLGVILPLEGRGSGRFQVVVKESKVEVAGRFESPSLVLVKQPLKEASGSLVWKNGTLDLSDLKFRVYGGEVKGHLRYGVKDQDYEIDLAAQGVNLTDIDAAIKGLFSFNLKGRGILNRNPAAGRFDVKNFQAESFRGINAAGDIEVRSSADRIFLKFDGDFSPGDNTIGVTVQIPFAQEPYSVEAKGKITNFELFLPWKGAKGQVDYRLDVRGGAPSPEVTCLLDFQGPLLPFPRFAHALTDYSGLILFEKGVATIRSFQGKLGGGDIQGFGEVRLGRGGFEKVRLNVEGKNMLLSPLERTRAVTDASLTLIKEEGRLSLEGNLLVQQLLWRREVFEKFAFSSSPYFESQKEPTLFDDLNLNIRIRADDNAWFDNSLGRIRTRFDLTLTGNVNDPIILGDIESLDGRVVFQDRDFRVLKGRLSFFNPLSAEPHLDFKGETYVTDYRVTFGLSGLLSRLKPEFASSPPLPPEDVLALLALGESFKRTYSTETSSQLSGGSFLSFQLAEQANKRVEKLFTLDRFRIDPFVLGSSAEMTARLTLGKKVSKNLSILYSTNLTTQREELVRLEWELSNELSIVGIRDEIGRISFDFKVRKRF